MSAHVAKKRIILTGVIGALAVAILAVAGWQLSQRGEEIGIRVRDARGMSAETTVLLYRGVPVGRVAAIEGDRLTVRIESRYASLIRSDSRVIVQRQNLPAHELIREFTPAVSAPRLVLELGSSSDFSAREFVAFDPPPPPSDPNRVTVFGIDIPQSAFPATTR